MLPLNGGLPDETLHGKPMAAERWWTFSSIAFAIAGVLFLWLSFIAGPAHEQLSWAGEPFPGRLTRYSASPVTYNQHLTTQLLRPKHLNAHTSMPSTGPHSRSQGWVGRLMHPILPWDQPYVNNTVESVWSPDTSLFLDLHGVHNLAVFHRAGAHTMPAAFYNAISDAVYSVEPFKSSVHIHDSGRDPSGWEYQLLEPLKSALPDDVYNWLASDVHAIAMDYEAIVPGTCTTAKLEILDFTPCTRCNMAVRSVAPQLAMIGATLCIALILTIEHPSSTATEHIGTTIGAPSVGIPAVMTRTSQHVPQPSSQGAWHPLRSVSDSRAVVSSQLDFGAADAQKTSWLQGTQIAMAVTLSSILAVFVAAYKWRHAPPHPFSLLSTAAETSEESWRGAQSWSSLTKDVKNINTTEDIEKILPHRYPFLLVDKVIEFEPGKRAVGIKNVTANEPQFTGHFPGRPIMPGVLMIEAMAQLGGIVCLQQPVSDGTGVFFFAGINGVRWRRPVVPGDTLVMEMELVTFKQKFGIAKMKGKAYVDGNLAVDVEEFTFALAK